MATLHRRPCLAGRTSVKLTVQLIAYLIIAGFLALLAIVVLLALAELSRAPSARDGVSSHRTEPLPAVGCPARLGVAASGFSHSSINKPNARRDGVKIAISPEVISPSMREKLGCAA